jgi:hypothetical protein
MDGSRDALFGKYEHKIKGFIEHESNLCEKEKNVLTELFNVEKSNSYSEAFTGETDFDTFMSMGEGQSAENDSVIETFRKNFIHHQFGKSFTITRQMADDAKLGMGAEMKARPKAFTRAFYKTRVDAACQALIHGTEKKMIFNKAEFDLTTGDGEALFSSVHPFKDSKYKGKQTNYFYGEVTKDGATFETALATLANKLRNFKDENNNTMGYVADTIILPCNRPLLEQMVKKVVGSERTVGSDFNDINTQYGNWTVVVLNNWETDDDRFMIMSSVANKTLMGNLFFNRVELDVTSYVDPASRNYIWNGYCRFGLGFRTWKHIALCVNSSTAVTGATAL